MMSRVIALMSEGGPGWKIPVNITTGVLTPSPNIYFGRLAFSLLWPGVYNGTISAFSSDAVGGNDDGAFVLRATNASTLPITALRVLGTDGTIYTYPRATATQATATFLRWENASFPKAWTATVPGQLILEFVRF